MARHVFYSFHYDGDCHRASQVRNIGAIEGQREANPNEWESIKRSGDAAIKGWIENEMKGKSCLVVLVGGETYARKWVRYEIERAWELKKGVLGIRIHKLKNLQGASGVEGPNPFRYVSDLALKVPLHDPAGWDSKTAYATIAGNIATWIDEAIENRKRYV